MKKIIRYTMNLLGEKQRHRIYRRMTRLPQRYLEPSYTVEIARTQADLQCAYALLHDCYVGIKIIDPQPSGLRCNLFSFLPTSTIIVAKQNGKVVGTVSTILDSKSGLPSDKDFLNENNRFRRQGKTLIEVSALAVASEHRGDHSVSIMLMSFLYNHCRTFFEGDYIVAAVHPRSEDFYKALMGFEKNGEPKRYGSLKGAAAIHISMDLSQEHLDKVTSSYTSLDPMKNIGALFQTQDRRFHYATKRDGLRINPVITPQVLEHFCLQQKTIWLGMSVEERNSLIQVYSTYFGSASMSKFRKHQPIMLIEKEYRTPVQVSSFVRLGDETRFCKILDLASGGCYVKWSNELPKAGDSIQISFRIAGRTFQMRGQVAWVNDGHSLAQNRGFGICFASQISNFGLQLKDWVYANQVSLAHHKEQNKVAST